MRRAGFVGMFTVLAAATAALTLAAAPQLNKQQATMLEHHREMEHHMQEMMTHLDGMKQGHGGMMGGQHMMMDHGMMDPMMGSIEGMGTHMQDLMGAMKGMMLDSTLVSTPEARTTLEQMQQHMRSMMSTMDTLLHDVEHMRELPAERGTK